MSRVPRSSRSFERIEKSDLIRLGEIAFETLKAEITKLHGIANWHEREIVNLCLCQGAADHYLNWESKKSGGVNDFDVWAFFRPQEIPRFGNKKAVTADFGPSKFGRSSHDPKRFIGRRVDVFWRTIPEGGHLGDPAGPIREYFEESEAPTACELRKKSAVAVWPEMEAGMVLWNPNGLGKPGTYDPWE